MELKKINLSREFYQSPNQENWKGRATKPELGVQYWYQAIAMIDLNEVKSKTKPDIGLLGYACDEGVRRNLGRVGAKNGPKTVRERLGKLAYHHSEKKVADFGDITCENTDLENCQKELSSVVSELLANKIFPIVIGGGHDIAYGHFKGVWNAVKNTSKPKIGIINFDAHFDLRPLDTEPNSGTPFYQILKEHGRDVDYLAIGIQEESNTSELFDIANKNQVSFIYNYDCTLENLTRIKEPLKTFITQNDWIYITIDLDGFSSAYAPGVSAPSPMGFSPFFVFSILNYLIKTEKVISLDIAELNPEFDIGNSTANLATRIINYVVSMLK
ncbi:formimidoylglutamase [Tenacibaculum agarivorans]|uniref:formimidoylglutamase n=1 Tax=Tenacibaculum agarivorans TaxID=1908389 RepID=UPI000AA3624E|nr:formimidoylglutamase [Tenacibaculum agarivorans]